MIRITDDIEIDESEIEESFIRSQGPGGQNVNKVASAVQLRFDARRSRSLPDAVAVRLMRLAGSKLTQDGVIVITAQRYRDLVSRRACSGIGGCERHKPAQKCSEAPGKRRHAFHRRRKARDLDRVGSRRSGEGSGQAHPIPTNMILTNIPRLRRRSRTSCTCRCAPR